MSIVFDLELTNQLSLLPDKDLVDLCHPIEPYQVTKNLNYELGRREQEEGRKSCLLSPVSWLLTQCSTKISKNYLLTPKTWEYLN